MSPPNMPPSNESCTTPDSTRPIQTPDPKPPVVPAPYYDSGIKEKSLQIPLGITGPPQNLISERSRIRLASAFFALLTLGWGDGGTPCLISLRRAIPSNSRNLVTGTLLPCRCFTHADPHTHSPAHY